MTLGSLRDAIAIVSQDVTLFDDTIRANIALGRLDASDDAIIAAAKAAAAHDFIMAQPAGYATEIGDRGLQTVWRSAPADRPRPRHPSKDAPILLLDEATSALDSESERLVQDALARFTRDRTTLVIAHRLSTVHECRSHLRHGCRRRRRDRHACRADGPRRQLCAAGQGADVDRCRMIRSAFYGLDRGASRFNRERPHSIRGAKRYRRCGWPSPWIGSCASTRRRRKPSQPIRGTASAGAHSLPGTARRSNRAHRCRPA